VYQSNEAYRKSRLTWFDLDGRPLGTVGEATNFFTVALSPDGRRVVATVLGNKNFRPRSGSYDLDRGVGSRFTFGARARISRRGRRMETRSHTEIPDPACA
jgi:hypothetical protein